MIDEIFIDNFKSLRIFDMKMSKFTVLIGMNGAGKTTILQAFDFLSQMMHGQFDSWLEKRNWVASDLCSKFSNSPNINLRVRSSHKLDDIAFSTDWLSNFSRRELACTVEVTATNRKNSSRFEHPLIVNRGERAFLVGKIIPTAFTYQGSILSQLFDKELSPELRTLRDSLRNIHSLEQLSPNLMRQKARGDATDIGFGGEKLSAFIGTIRGEQKETLVHLLQQFYPKLVDIKVSAIKGGWKRLSIVEEFGDERIETEARHINDGLLRILAILAQSKTARSLLIFDEIENGVNPELVQKLVQTLIESDQQIIVTTHSPMILNYLDDETAREAVQFVYKAPEGFTCVRRFFDIPRINEKLKYMGAGEAFIDTDLKILEDDCNALDKAEEKNSQTITKRQVMALIKAREKQT
jgi:predicted ATPase